MEFESHAREKEKKKLRKM